MLSLDGDQAGKLEWTVADVSHVAHVIHSNLAPAVGQWIHIVATVTMTGSLEMYVNGVKQTEGATLASIGYLSSPVEIGRWGTRYFDGAIDQVAVYARPLSPSEVLAWYDARMPGASTSFAKADSFGHVTDMRSAYEGRYLASKFAYDGYGNVVTTWDFGSGVAGVNTTQYVYSDFYGGAYPTKLVRADGKVSFASFDRDL